MATKIRTLDFLPEIFQTPTNAQFLAATLDQLVAQPSVERIQGYIGTRVGYGINAKDYYVTEPTKVRTDYQLDPGVVFRKTDQDIAQDFISYPGILDALRLEGGITNNNNRLFNSEFYSWDSFTNLDTNVNFHQYYWLPEGLPPVVVTSATAYSSEQYYVIDGTNSYQIATEPTGTSLGNPTLTLLRGGTYTFTVDQTSQFWIQGQPGITGYSITQPNVQTRDVLGVVNNGATAGVVTFTVPAKNAQDVYNLPGNNTVDVVSTLLFSQVNGSYLNTINDIDGITSLNGLTVMFYNTGNPNEMAYGQLVSAQFFTITYTGSPSNPQLQLTPAANIPISQKITAQYGTDYSGRQFFRNTSTIITLIPYLSAELDILYYQDGTSSDKVGMIRLVDSNTTDTIDVVTEILGKTTYTSPNGVTFTNGLKVQFQGNIVPEAYTFEDFYVEGVGTAIELIPVSSLIVPESFSTSVYLSYDSTPWDISGWSGKPFIPVDPDYITIARNALSKNAWSRSNRWFHIDVIRATAEYNNDPTILLYASEYNKAKRPIIEFYPNLRLFDSGTEGKAPLNFIDFRTTDPLLLVSGEENYYPDVQVYTDYTATIATTSYASSRTATATNGTSNEITCGSTTGFRVNDLVRFTISSGAVFGNIVAGEYYYVSAVVSSTKFTISETKGGDVFDLSTGIGTMQFYWTPQSTVITIDGADVTGTFKVGQYITDSTNLLPPETQISSVSGTTTLTLEVVWDTISYSFFTGTTTASLIAVPDPVNNYALFNGARVVFAAATDPTVRTKIYIARYSVISGTTPVLTLSEAPNGEILVGDQAVVISGYNYAGKSFWYDGLEWLQAQQKNTVNQPPLFDVFDENGISFGDKAVYVGSSFIGSKLFAYGIGTGTKDSVLGFPIRYSTLANIGDISFDVSINTDTFDYVSDFQPITHNVNTGYVYNYETRSLYNRELGWQTAVSPSIQYQVFEFDYYIANPQVFFTCDVAVDTTNSTNWPVIKVLVNNILLSSTDYEYIVTANSTIVNIFSIIPTDTIVQILLYSNQASATAYYSIPINLSNNPLNANLEVVNVGDIKNQYQTIFYNNPNTMGEAFGPNNYRDLGNLVPWGDRIIQNSASLVLPGAFLRKPNQNIFNALMFNSREYIKFKTLLVDTVNNTDYSQRFNPSTILDDALTKINQVKIQSQPFFWSDMIPSKTPYIINSYTYTTSSIIPTYPLSQVYNFSTANYSGVLVYLSTTISNVTITKQLVTNQDYIISTTIPSLTIISPLQNGDVIIIKEYNQTYGSYVPNTPTKLGLYPAFIPEVVLDSDYAQPTYFIKGHDGSYNKLYGRYDTNLGVLVDFRDQALLEFELRVYNNLKLSTSVPISQYDIIPGFFRETAFTNGEILEIYSKMFLNWVGQNRIDYKKQLYNKNDQFTFNYYQSGNKINQDPIYQGYWRGVYQWYYDTTTPNLTPWQMLGFQEQPSWWETRYGPAPYTSNNLILWNDLAEGIDWNNGNPVVLEQFVRPQLLQVIPVNSAGELLSPFDAIVGNYTAPTFQHDWKVGDEGPAELSYRRSSSWPFDLMRIYALTEPTQFFNLCADLDNYKFNTEFNQYLVNNRSHLIPANIQVYGTGTPKTSYMNWVVDYEKQLGVDATQNIIDLLNNLDVRLVYRVAGFTDKNLINFYIEKATPNSTNASLLIPDASYQVLLYDNQPFDRIIYSSVIVQITSEGYLVFGNSQTQAYFTTLKPKFTGINEVVTVETLTVKLATDYSNEEVIVPYGTLFYTVQEVAQFLTSYGAYLQAHGMVFDEILSGIEVSWNQMVSEFLYWVQLGWENGSLETINPAAGYLKINRDGYIVQPLTIRQENFVLNQNLYPIQANDLNVLRDGTLFLARPVNNGDSLAYGQFNIGNLEDGIVFNNITLFDDVIYDLVTGSRQLRIYVRGSKTAAWDGTLTASGFILNQDNVLQWNKDITYTKGSIVLYKNKYWVALRIVQPSATFNEQNWRKTEYDQIQKGLLPNSSTRSYESTLYYDSNKANIEEDADLLSFSLIGYRPRDYLATVDLTEITQINVYKNLIKNKGTLNAASAFKGANLPQGGIDYDIYENWAIKAGEFGGVLNTNFVEFKISESLMTGNPSIVALTNGATTVGAEQEVPLYSLFNYGRSINDPDILAVTPINQPSTLYPDAGYVNYNDVRMSSYFYANLPTAVNQNGTVIPLSEFYVREYVWLASYLGTWQVYTPASIGPITQALNNLNGTVTITFANQHNLSQYNIFAIINLNPAINGYYIATYIVDPFRVIINLNLDPNIRNATGLGVGLSFQNQRVSTPADINNLNLLNSEFIKNTVWVDTYSTGDWAVLRKSINYQYEQEFNKLNSSTYGSAVATGTKLGYLIGDSGAGEVYRYTYNEVLQTYQLIQTITGNVSFGTTISHAGDLYVISETTTNYSFSVDPTSWTWNTSVASGPITTPTLTPTLTPTTSSTTNSTPAVYLYILENNVLSDDLVLYQNPITGPVNTKSWGAATAISGDKNWLYISDYDNNSVYVYRRNNVSTPAGFFIVGQTYTITDLGTTDFTLVGATNNIVGLSFIATGIGSGTGATTNTTYRYITVIDGNELSLTTSVGDNFGYSISTDYYGQTVTIGAPGQTINSITDSGAVYLFSRSVQNVEVQVNTTPGFPQVFRLGWSPVTARTAVFQTSSSSNTITCAASTRRFNVNDPVIFYGKVYPNSNISFNQIYYIHSIVNDTTFRIKVSREQLNPYQLTNSNGNGMIVSVQTVPIYVSLNGTIVADNQYGMVGSLLYYVGSLISGDIINVSGNKFTYFQQLTNPNNYTIGSQYGFASANNLQSTEILVSAPFQINNQVEEGGIFRYTNGGASYGQIFGTSICNVTATIPILLNGYLVLIPEGNATVAANAINSNKVTNVTATTSGSNNEYLVISLINQDLAIPNASLSITVFNINTLTELGITVYTQTQTISCPHLGERTQFGTTIKFNEQNSFVASAPVGSRYSSTTFDFTDDENFTNDTVFDNNATQWVDIFVNAGAVYMFDYLSVYNENINNTGDYVLAQDANARNIDYGKQPYYGTALDFNNYSVIVGAPLFRPDYVNGQVVTFLNTSGEKDWALYRSSAPIVDINRIQNAQLFSALTNETLINLDYIDPLQGKLLGAVSENIDYVSNVDPANYNNQNNLKWGVPNLGQLWFDTSNVRFVNYHQNDLVYNSQYWGAVFPGSDVAVYSWISSSDLPINYQGPGTPYDVTLYCTQFDLNANNVLAPVYFYWVRNTNIIFTKLGNTLSDSIIETYIRSPKNSGISYFAPLLPNTFGLYNSGDYINVNDSVFHIGYSTGTNDDVGHTSYDLIRADYADDFLSGLPQYGANLEPQYLYRRFLASMSGVDDSGQVVPDPFLPIAVRSGVQVRPRQSFFLFRLLAVKNYLTYANEILAQFPIIELRPQATFLYKSGPFYNTADYWEYVNWWATGYDNNTKAAVQVPFYADLSTLDVAFGTIAQVTANGNGNSETYIYTVDGIWVRIGLTNGTIAFKSSLWDYAGSNTGFGANYFDTTPYDQYPSTETYYILRALNEQIYIDDFTIYRNKSLILTFEYIVAETAETQNYLPWLNKTSLVDVTHTLRELKPYEVFSSDNQDFLYGYLNEVKPYHVVFKEFLFKYTKTEPYLMNVTDFDLPAQYIASDAQFISPELVYSNPSGDSQFLPENPIWNQQEYTQWYQNYGLSITGHPDFNIATLESYISINTTEIAVSNINGFPIAGTIKIGTELISYETVNRETYTLGGLSRGLNGTPINNHLPGELIYTDLPPVLVVYGSHGYTEPPRVTAYIDTSIYSAPRIPAVFAAVMNVDSVLEIEVINPGSGYAVLPTIVVDPAETYTFGSGAVNIILNTITLEAPNLVTGDQVQYEVGVATTAIGPLVDGEWYYVNVLSSSPVTTVALYNNYNDAVNDTFRINFTSTGTGSSQSFNLGARAFAITNSTPVRENIITMRFDRTSYEPQVVEWVPEQFYGASYAGNYNQISSSSIQLESTSPPIGSVLASGQGIGLEIDQVENQVIYSWSGFPRRVTNTYSGSNTIKLVPYDGSVGKPTASGSTIGFYVGMPIRIDGASIGGIITDVTYYVHSIVSDVLFTISQTVSGSVYPLTTATAVADTVTLYTAQVINQAILTVNYPGILEVTSIADSNIITVPLNPTGTGGTNGFYVNMPVFFTGDVYGGIIANEVYYVHTICSSQTFTISTQTDPVVYTLANTAATGNLVTLTNQTMDLAVNDTIIFTNFVFTSGNFVVGQTYTIVSLGTTNYTLIGAPFNGIGATFTATGVGTGTGTASSGVFGNLISGQIYYVASVASANSFSVKAQINSSVLTLINSQGTGMVSDQTDTVDLVASTGTMIINCNLPISPGQITGQQFSMYTTSRQYPNISGPVGNLITRTLPATLAGSNRIPMTYTSGGATNIYVNMPFKLAKPIGGLSAGPTVYYVKEVGTTSIPVISTSAPSTVGVVTGSISAYTLTVTARTSGLIVNGATITGTGIAAGTTIISQLSGLPNSTGTYLVSTSQTVASTAITLSISYLTIPSTYSTNTLYAGMPVVFDALSIGGVDLNTEYFVRSIISATQFSISLTLGGDAVIMSTGTGNYMRCTGQDYITVSATQGGPVIPLLGSIAANDSFTFTQYPILAPVFDVSWILGGYNVVVTNPGLGYAVSNTITIPGTLIGGTTNNNLTITVNKLQEYAPNQSYGAIADVITAGVVPTQPTKYFLKAVTANQLAVYSNSQLTVPVSGINFPYYGTTQTTVTGTIGTSVFSVDPTSWTWNISAASGTHVFIAAPSTWTWNISAASGIPTTTTTTTTTSLGTTTTTTAAPNPSNIIIVTSTTGFNLNDPVVFTGNVGGGLILGKVYYILTVTPNLTVSLKPGDPSTIVTVSTAPFLNFTMAKLGDFAFLPEPIPFNQSIVKFNNQVYACVVSNNDAEFVLGKWALLNSDDRRLNALDRIIGYYAPTVNMPGAITKLGQTLSYDIITYDSYPYNDVMSLNIDLSQLLTGTTYPNSTYLGNNFNPDLDFVLDTELSSPSFTSTESTVYDVEGAPFTFGYAPEELVPGLVTDNLTFVASTRPGVDWPVTEYQNNGFNVLSLEIPQSSPTQTVYSFANVTQVPAQLKVFAINPTTMVSVSKYVVQDYTVDWVNSRVTLNSPLSSGNILRIDIYETGNGYQLDRSNTIFTPLRDNDVTGLQEIYLDSKYAGTINDGNGLVVPYTQSQMVEVIATESGVNLIYCADVAQFILNNPITFQGNVFGNIQENTTYYVKTINLATLTITISLYYDIINGIAGTEFVVSTATGSMEAVINVGADELYTPPLVMVNGNELTLGAYGQVTQLNGDPILAGNFIVGKTYVIVSVGTTDFVASGAASNLVGILFVATNAGSGTGTVAKYTITCNNTGTLNVNDTIVFSNEIFGSVIQPLTTYYVKTIWDANEFTIAATLGGATIALTSATGIATFVTNDYTVGRIGNTNLAKLVFANQYDTTNDYISYTVLGQTAPTQYGYSIPETQLLTGTGSTSTFSLTNYVGGQNINSAVVEINGIRQTSSLYTINPSTNQIIFTSPPAGGSKIAVTTYNLTDNQYLHTQYGITNTSANVVTAISYINKNITNSIFTTSSATQAGTNYITCLSTTGFAIGDTVFFTGTSSYGNLSVSGVVYFIAAIISPTQFTIKDQFGTIISLTTASSFSLGTYVGGQPAVRVTTSTNHGFANNNIIRIADTLGSVGLNNELFYARVISNTVFDLYSKPYNFSVGAPNYPVITTQAYIGGGYTWINGTFILTTTLASATSASTNIITVASTSELIVDTPVLFRQAGIPIGDISNGGMVIGAIYYVKQIVSPTQFTISASLGGDIFELNTSAVTINVTEFQQIDVDRLWVTINGYRVASSSLYLNPGNELSILTTVAANQEVIITNMIPNSTPNKLKYLLNVNQVNYGSVYRGTTAL
jgi:hypothetical protein